MSLPMDEIIEIGAERLRLRLERVVPPPVINVRDYGAKGDGITEDSAALRRAQYAVPEGGTLKFPAGKYLLSEPLLLDVPGAHVVGELGAFLIHGQNRGVEIDADGVELRDLSLIGRPGLYLPNNNKAHGILIGKDVQKTVIERCRLQGPGNGIYALPGSARTVITECQITGWGGSALGLSGSSTIVSKCLFEQDDPVREPRQSGHGVYLHSGAHDILITDCKFRNVRDTGFHCYGQEAGTTIERVTVRRTWFEGCQIAALIASFPGTASRAKEILFEDCSFTSSYASIAVVIRHGDGIVMERCWIAHTPGGTGIAVGYWAPWEPRPNSLTGFRMTNCHVENCAIGIYPATFGRGTFEGCRIGPNKVTNCPRPYVWEPTVGMEVII